MKNEKKSNDNREKLISSNKKAFFDFLLFDKFEAGIELTGTEIKSVRKNAVNLKDSFVKITPELQAYLVNCHISPYEFGNIFNHDPKRERRLLLHKKEILKILNKVKQEKFTIVPTRMYFQNRYAKLEIALAKGKKLYDKRESLKTKDLKREIERNK